MQVRYRQAELENVGDGWLAGSASGVVMVMDRVGDVATVVQNTHTHPFNASYPGSNNHNPPHPHSLFIRQLIGACALS